MTETPNNDPPTPEDGAEPSDADHSDSWEAVDTQETIDDDQWVQVHQAHYDRESDRELVTALVTAIAEAKDVDPIDDPEMPPLFESLDAAALERTFFGSPGTDPRHRDGGLVTFHYTGYKVALRADGWIFVYESR